MLASSNAPLTLTRTRLEKTRRPASVVVGKLTGTGSDGAAHMMCPNPTDVAGVGSKVGENRHCCLGFEGRDIADIGTSWQQHRRHRAVSSWAVSSWAPPERVEQLRAEAFVLGDSGRASCGHQEVTFQLQCSPPKLPRRAPRKWTSVPPALGPPDGLMRCTLSLGGMGCHIGKGCTIRKGCPNGNDYSSFMRATSRH